MKPYSLLCLMFVACGPAPLIASCLPGESWLKGGGDTDYCIDLTFPPDSVASAEAYCSNKWGGEFSIGVRCPTNPLVGTCSISSYYNDVINFYSPNWSVESAKDTCIGLSGDAPTRWESN